MVIARSGSGITCEVVMELRDVDQFVREGKFAQALEAIDRVRDCDPDNPYTAAYEVRVRALLEDASANTGGETILGAVLPALPSVESQLSAIASPIPAGSQNEAGLTNAAGEMERVAVLSRIADLLGSATGFLSKGEYDSALEALDQAQTLDPQNKEIAVFEDRVRAARRDALALHLEPGTDTVSGGGAPVSEIPAMLAAAREAAAHGDFSEALRAVTTAGILEPGDPEVERCEAEIRTMQEALRQREQRRDTAEQDTRRDQGVQAASVRRSDADQERRHTEAVIARHIEQAQNLFNAGEYGHALVEIDHAFLLNPLDQRVRNLQKEISGAQSREARTPRDPGRVHAAMIAGYFAEAHRLRARGKPEEALQAIGKVLLLDPGNSDALARERILQMEIAVAAPLREAPVLPVTKVRETALTRPTENPGKGQPRKMRRKAYLVAGSILAATVVSLMALIQVLSWADGHSVRPEPPLPMVSVDSLTNGDRAQTDPARTVPPSADRGQQTVTPAAESRPDTVSSAQMVPGVLRLERPVLPESSLGADASTERVTVRVLVDSTGRPMLAAVVASTNPAFNQPVINAAMHSAYVPWSGGQVSRWITIPLTFTN